VDYCHSGRIRRIDEEAIHRQLDNGAIVLMGPVAVSVTGESFNLTSEEIATQLAVKLKAEKMIGFCSRRVYNQDGVIVSELFPNEAQARVEELGGRRLQLRHRALARLGLPQRRAALPPDQLSGRRGCCRSCSHATVSAPRSSWRAPSRSAAPPLTISAVFLS
jgi:hypothetical protein